MKRSISRLGSRQTYLVALLLASPCIAASQEPAKPYATMAPLSSYMETSQAAEVALARSAAPQSISGDADVLVLSAGGYGRAVAGKNGWTCLVERSWNDQFDKPEFWNPKIRVPICFNAAASRSILPVYLDRTKWVLAKRSLADVVAESKLHAVPDPESGSFAMMLSKQGYLGDGIGAAAPHVMVFEGNTPAALWGANFDASPVAAAPGDKESITVFFLSARKWSDGTPFIPKQTP